MSAYPFPAAAPYPAAPAPSVDPTAVMGRRSAAWIVDLLLFALLAAFFSATPLSPFAKYEEVPEGFDDPCEAVTADSDVYTCLEIGDRVYYNETGDAVLGFAVEVLWFLGIYGLLQGLTGMTPGKALLGVRVVNEQGQVPGIGKSLARSLLWIVDGAPWCLPLVGIITGFSTKGHRRVGDMAAKTFVVAKDDVGRPVVVPGLTTGYGAYMAPGYGPPGEQGQPPWGAPPGTPGPDQPPWGAPMPPGAQWGQSTPAPGTPPTGTPADPRPAPPTGGWPAPGAGTGPASGEQPVAPGGPGTTWPGPAAEPPGAAVPPSAAAERRPEPPSGPPTGEPETASAFAPPRGETPGEGRDEPTATPLGPATTEPEAPSRDEPAATPLGPATAEPETASRDEPTATPLGPATTGPEPSREEPAEPTATPLGPATAGGQQPPERGDQGDRGPAGGRQPESPPEARPESQPAAARQQQSGTGYEPQWDAARNTYIVWEPNRRQWLGWDDAAKEWRPL